MIPVWLAVVTAVAGFAFGAFGAGERPETPARLRKPPQPAEG